MILAVFVCVDLRPEVNLGKQMSLIADYVINNCCTPFFFPGAEQNQIFINSNG